jgi:predicted P-loop ATPase
MSKSPELDGAPLEEVDVGRMCVAIDGKWGFDSPIEKFTRAMHVVANERQHHPVRSYLDSLTWDQIPRIERIAEVEFGATSRLHAVMIAKTLIAAVARAYQPGCKVDTVTVLVGLQGVFKSSFWRELASSPFFSDTHIDPSGDKDSLLTLHAAWIFEWAEIDGMLEKREAADVKRFTSSAVDIFRPPYSRAASRHPRSGIIVGTTNRWDFLQDATGSRRVHAVPVLKEVDAERIRSQRDQWFAEAVAAYKLGEKWWLTKEEEAARVIDAQQFELTDTWETLIEKWIAEENQTHFTMADVLSCAVNVPRHSHTLTMSKRVGGILRKLGYDNGPISEPGALPGAPKKRLWHLAKQGTGAAHATPPLVPSPSLFE